MIVNDSTKVPKGSKNIVFMRKIFCRFSHYHLNGNFWITKNLQKSPKYSIVKNVTIIRVKK